MKRQGEASVFVFSFLAILAFGCQGPEVLITHAPVVPRSNETVTFTARLTYCNPEPCTVSIHVNGINVLSRAGIYTGEEITYTGGPYTGYEHWVVNYQGRATDRNGTEHRTITYQFGVTDASYNYRPLGTAFTWVPARNTGPWHLKEDFVFHKGPDYTTFSSFVSDVTQKINNVYGRQAILSDPTYLDTFNFYVYLNTAASTSLCGSVHPNADLDMSWRDADAILHVADFRDCTIDNHFTAEGSNTKAFLHESGHGVFGLADEYDDAHNRCANLGYWQTPHEPNIFDTENDCRTEQTAKGRDPNVCWEFTPCSGGWWGIHRLTDETVMKRGLVGDPWGIEAQEYLFWYFSRF